MYRSENIRAEAERSRTDASKSEVIAANDEAGRANARAEVAAAQVKQMETAAAALRQRVTQAEDAVRAGEGEIGSLKAELAKLRQSQTDKWGTSSASNTRLSRENADLAQQLAKLKTEKQKELEERDLMARAQLGSLSHSEQMQALAIMKKIKAHAPITFEENQRLTVFCGGSVARTLLFPEFEQAGEQAIQAWVDKNSKTGNGSASKKAQRPKTKKASSLSQDE